MKFGSNQIVGVLVGAVIGLGLIFALFQDRIFNEAETESSVGITKEPRIELISAEDLLAKMKEDPAKAKLVNVWATWCKPCVKEMPYIMKTYEKLKDQGMSLYLVTADIDSEVEKARKFLRDFGVDFTTYKKGDEDNEFIGRMSSDWTGALPATFVYDQSGSLADFWMGEATQEEFEQAVSKVLDGQD